MFPPAPTGKGDKIVLKDFKKSKRNIVSLVKIDKMNLKYHVSSK